MGSVLLTESQRNDKDLVRTACTVIILATNYDVIKCFICRKRLYLIDDETGVLHYTVIKC